MWSAEFKLIYLHNLYGNYRSVSSKLQSNTDKYKILVREICLSKRHWKTAFIQALNFMKEFLYKNAEDVLIDENAIFVETSPWYLTDENGVNGVAFIMLHALPSIKEKFKAARRSAQHLTDEEKVFIRRLKFHSFTGYPSFFRTAAVVGSDVVDQENESQAIGMCSCGISGFMQNQPVDPLHAAVDEAGHIVALKQSIDNIQGTKSPMPYKFQTSYHKYSIPDDKQRTKFTSISSIHGRFQKFIDSLLTKFAKDEMKTFNNYTVMLMECRDHKKFILDNYCSKIYIPTKNVHLTWEEVHQMKYAHDDEIGNTIAKYTMNEKENAEGEMLAQVVAYGGHIRLFYILELFLLQGERTLQNDEDTLARTLLQKAKVSDTESINFGIFPKKKQKKKKKGQASSSQVEKDKQDKDDTQKEDIIPEDILKKEEDLYYNLKLDQQEAKLQKEHDALQKFHIESKWILYGDPTDETFSKYFTESPSNPTVTQEHSKHLESQVGIILENESERRNSNEAIHEVGMIYPLPLIVTIEDFKFSWKRNKTEINVKRSLKFSYYLKEDEEPVEKVYVDANFFNLLLNGNFFYSFDEIQTILKKEMYRSLGQTVILKNYITFLAPKWSNSLQTFYHTLPKDSELFVIAFSMGDFETLDSETFLKQKVCKHLPTIVTRSTLHVDIIHLHHFQIKAETKTEVQDRWKSSYKKLKKQFPRESLVQINMITPISTDTVHTRLSEFKLKFQSVLKFQCENGDFLSYDKLPNVVAKIENVDETTHSIRLTLVNTDYKIDVDNFVLESNLLNVKVMETLSKTEKQELTQMVDIHQMYAPMQKEIEVAIQDDKTGNICKVKLYGFYKVRNTIPVLDSRDSIRKISIIIANKDYKQFQEWSTLNRLAEISSEALFENLARNYRNGDKFWETGDPATIGMVNGPPFWKVYENAYPTLIVPYLKLHKGKLVTIDHSEKFVKYDASADIIDPNLETNMLNKRILPALREVSFIVTHDPRGGGIDSIFKPQQRLDSAVDSIGALLSFYFLEPKQVITQRLSSANFFPEMLDCINTLFYSKGTKHAYYWNKYGIEIMKMMSKIFSACNVATVSDTSTFMNWDDLMHYVNFVIDSFLSGLTNVDNYFETITRKNKYASIHMFDIIGPFVERSPSDKLVMETQNVYLLFVNALFTLSRMTDTGDTSFDIHEEFPSFKSYEKSIFLIRTELLSRQIINNERLRQILIQDESTDGLLHLTHVSDIQILCFLQDHFVRSPDSRFLNHLQIIKILKLYYSKRIQLLKMISKLHRTLTKRHRELPVEELIRLLIHEIYFHAQFSRASVEFMYTTIPLQHICECIEMHPNITKNVLLDEVYRTYCQTGLNSVKHYISADNLLYDQQPSAATISNRTKIQKSVNIIETFLQENVTAL